MQSPGPSSLIFPAGTGSDTTLGAGGGSGDVTAASNLGNNLLIRGDGVTKGVQNTGISISDTDDMSGIKDIALTGTVDTRDIATDGTKLDAIEASADVTDATNVNTAGATMNTDYNAQTVLLAASDDTPVAVTISATELIGRKSSGAVGKLTATEARTIPNGTTHPHLPAPPT